MNLLKKIAAVLAAAVVCTFPAHSVYAEIPTRSLTERSCSPTARSSPLNGI